MLGNSAALENEENTEEYEEVDVLSLMASQSDEEEDVADDDDDSEDVEVLRDRVSKRNKSLKKSKQAIHRLQDENSALMERLEKLEQAVTHNGQGEPDQAKLEQEAQEWMDRVADDPAQAIKYADWKQAKLEQGLSNWAANFQEEVMGVIAELKGAVNPERQKFEKELAYLRNDPDFEGWSDDQLLPIARKLGGTKIKRPRGSLAGNRAKSTEPPKRKRDPELLKRMGFE